MLINVINHLFECYYTYVQLVDNYTIFMFVFFVAHLADWVKTCQIDDPAFEECSRESIQGLFKQLAKGKVFYIDHRLIFWFMLMFENSTEIAIHFNLTWIQLGIEGFDEIDTIDPMKLNRIKIFQGDGPVSINSSLSRASVTGFGDTQVVKSK